MQPEFSTHRPRSQQRVRRIAAHELNGRMMAHV